MNLPRQTLDHTLYDVNAVDNKPVQLSAEHSGADVKSKQAEQVLLFGPFRLDRTNAILARDEQQLTITPKAFDLLCFMAESPGQLLTKDVIFAQIWPRLVVSDAALSVCIREIRKVLGDSSKAPRYIGTVHKRGFRFIGETSSAAVNAIDNHPEPAIRHQSLSKLIGRDKPLQIMQQSLEKALTGVRQTLFVTGEPGIGKTTIIETFIKNNFSNTNTLVAKGHCIEHYGAGEAYLPFLDALGDLARSKGLELTNILSQHAPSWLQHLPALNREQDHPMIHEVLSDVNPQCMLRELTGALEALSEKKLLILILEDLHWSDHATIDLLSFLARRDNPARLLIIGSYRPADACAQNHPVKNLQQDLKLRNRCITFPLEFLERQHIVSYLAARFPDHDFPNQFPEFIHQQSDGNPLFIINLLQYLQDTELLKYVNGQWQLLKKLSMQDRWVPDDLEQMINQQIEQLDQECQAVLETASIASEPGGIAVQFTLTEVAAALGIDELVAEPCLERFARNGHFLHSLSVSEDSGGNDSNDYEFTHAIYQNVLYSRVSSVRKVQIHNRLALRLEKDYGSRSNEIANKLAVHFEIGRDYYRAVQYLLHVAATAARCGANRDATYTLDKAKQLLTKLPETVERDRLELSLLLLLGPAITASEGNATPVIEICYLRARELCEQLKAQFEQFRVLFGLRSFYLIRGELTKAHQLAQSLLELATTLDDSGLLLEAHVGLASSEFFAGNHQTSHQHAIQGITLYDQHLHAEHAALYGLDPGVFCYARAGQTAWPLGYPDQALAHVNHAVDLAGTLNHPYSLVFAIHNLTQVLLYRCDTQAALASAKRGKALAQEHGFSFLSAWAFHLCAWAFALAGDIDNARSEIKLAHLAERPNAPAADCFLATFMAETYWRLGDVENGMVSLSVPCIEHSYEIENIYLHAEFILLSNEFEQASTQAEMLLNKALKLSRLQQLKSYELRSAISLCKLLMQQKRNQQAYESLAEITKWFKEGFDTPEWQEAKQLLEQLEAVLVDHQQNPDNCYSSCELAVI